MPEIIRESACPTFTPEPLVGPSCLVFEACTQKIAEARIPAANATVAALGPQIGNAITGALPAGLTLPTSVLNPLIVQVAAQMVAAGVLKFEACLPSDVEPRFEGKLLRDKIINCGDVEATLNVRTIAPFTTTLAIPIQPPISITLTIPAGIAGCALVSLTIQEEEEAPGVRPTDCILERLVDFEGSTTCVVTSTVADPISGGLTTTSLVLIKASFVVLKKVVRVMQPTIPPCTTDLCPPTPGVLVTKQPK